MNANIEAIKLKNVNMLCRLCLNEGGTLIPLFRVNDIECKVIGMSTQVTMCTAVTVCKFDSLPKKICVTCRNFVREWFLFRRNCLKVDAVLKKAFRPTEKLNAKNEDEEPLLCEPSDRSDDDTVSDNDASCVFNLSLTEKQQRKSFSCDHCLETFSFLSELSLHRLSKHYNKRRLKISSDNRVEKKLEDPIKRVRCKFEMICCGKLFLNRSLYRQHRQQRHPKEKPYACDICGKRNFISDETLKRHKLLHTGRYTCDTCQKTFTCQAILRIHIRDKHENDRPFVCDVCGKAFVTELLLSYHQRIHTGEKKYVCEECGLAVVTSSSLAKHKRIHSKVKPHVCEVCGKGFIVRGRLIEHIRLHTGERPFVCEICRKSFTMRDKLKRHVRTHMEHKPYSCEICGRGYSTNHGLSLHLKTHSSRHQVSYVIYFSLQFTMHSETNGI